MRLSVFAGRAAEPLAILEVTAVPRAGEKLRLQSSDGTPQTFIIDDAVWLPEQDAVHLLVSPMPANKPTRTTKRG